MAAYSTWKDRHGDSVFLCQNGKSVFRYRSVKWSLGTEEKKRGRKCLVMFVRVNVHIFKSSLKREPLFQSSVTKTSFYVPLKQESFFFF